MKVTIKKPTHVYVLNGDVEVSETEAHRLMMLGVCEIGSVIKEIRTEVKEEKKETKKAKAVK